VKPVPDFLPPRSPAPHRPGVRGFTLIETLVALAVAAMLGLLLFISFTSLESNGIRASDSSRLQDHARVSMTLLSDDLSRAGFMMNGPSGQGRCARLLTYNSNLNPNQMSNQWPVSSVVQSTSGYVPGTSSTAFNYASPGGAATDAITMFYAANFGQGGTVAPGSVRVVKASNGSLSNAALFVANNSAFQVGDVDIVVLPARNICIRFQITGTGGAANQIVHNSGSSTVINPPNGFNGVSSLANPAVSPAITTADLAQAYVQDFGQISGASGPIQVSYSIRPDPTSPGTPDLWRTVINALGTVVSDSPVAGNVVLLHALYAPVVSGQLQGFVPWSTISGANQQGQVGAVELAYVVRKPNTAGRTGNPATLSVLDETYTPPAGNAWQYQVFTQTVYLRNVAWNQ
jgi:prepilin-type N-terminal cleavage/methylation domain-containing protein